ncbi:DUF7007 domain-containing protein [Rhizobium laguerreae]|uniref:DUF7007 domain-containing protein n=1 Tax=Rhizobium laguerreae TaxID=1076926 RepID=UPI003917EE5B
MRISLPDTSASAPIGRSGISWPDAWEAIFGRPLAPGESHEKDRRAFEREHAGDWIVISALRSEQHAGMTEVIATIGGVRATDEERRYLVPSDEYEVGRFGFVIDPARHAAYDGSSSFINWQARVISPWIRSVPAFFCSAWRRRGERPATISIAFTGRSRASRTQSGHQEGESPLAPQGLVAVDALRRTAVSGSRRAAQLRTANGNRCPSSQTPTSGAGDHYHAYDARR